MKKRLLVVLIVIGVIVSCYLLVGFYSNYKLETVKTNVLQQNPEITKVESINSVGKWGEWFSEYALVVEKNGALYRIWAKESGEMTDSEVYNMP